MLLLLSMFVLFTAIVGFFSREIVDYLSRLFSISGVKIFLPIFLVSLVVETDAVWSWWGLSSFRMILSSTEQAIVQLMPFQTVGKALARISLLTLLGCLPLGIALVLTRKKPMAKAPYYAYRIGAFLWVLSVIVLVS